METLNIKHAYKEIFKSHDNPTLEKHIEKIIELDVYLPYSSTFFCITNTQNLSFEYISKNMKACLGIDNNDLKSLGMRYFWSRIHPDDLEIWLSALNELMKFTLKEISIEDRMRASYTWNYRFRDANDNYVNVIQNTTPLEFDSDNKPIIGLAHYTVLSHQIEMQICASAKLLNANNEYETIYFNNFSQKLLSDCISNRERDIIRLLILNYSSKTIGKSLGITANTVDTHRRNILRKLNISSTGELIGMLKMNKNLI
ncbi:LuxR family transcriptional regulator [Algibacter amylolyticus]|uniref:LuxR family transcriptional regulator n=1 Tax=Algibacter amylolyticus TaxID=1608400 RepID=A0A5M7BH68_9FLAO|nr:LuxR C-terminal-related transcriptional regulator [Algibacter amylolyticus]KAA5828080.1 PAS domain-containing protein [Algibacter amylolyticus]MBB5267328.1 DNA-binding CsgD family transcriptional regulator [Algibacter amylolyticus]TSJ82325.1 LuxR family transcriptional regulator [Algibacter amylolyticus]